MKDIYIEVLIEKAKPIVTVLMNGERICIKGGMKFIVHMLLDLVDFDNNNVYLEVCGYGNILGDMLTRKNLKFNKLKFRSI